MSTPTQITIHPDRAVQEISHYPSSAKRLAGERFAFGSPAPTSPDMFGEDGFTTGDALDIINPLHHIPFVSTLYEELTGDTASVGAKLAGGALLGGPLGFLAALGNVIFAQETGHSMGGAVVAGILGGEQASSGTQMAATEAAAPQPQLIAMPVAAAATQEVAQAQILPPLPPALPKEDGELQALFGASAKSAHDSYRKAQFNQYLSDVTTSQLL